MSEELLTAARERIASLLEPINGGVGEDISYDEQFEEIKSETEKLASLTGESCDWSSIAVTAQEILEDKSKDYRVTCYLVACKAREGSLQGVLDGLVLLQDMTGKWWEEMYPPLRRIRARAGMVGWMSDQAGPVMIDYKLKAADREMVQTINELSQSLDTDYRERYGDHYTGMSKLREAVRRWLQTLPKEAPKKAPPKPAPVTSAATAAAAPAGGSAVVTAAPMELSGARDAERAIDPAGQTLLRIAAALRAEKPDDERIYRLSRLGMWLPLEGAPPTQDGKSLVPPPPAHVKQRFDSLAQAQDWLTLLGETETQAAEFLLWLDPHRYASTAMSAMGALFMKAKQELLLQVAIMLKRIPTLPKLAFSDGTPFADGATQMWLESEVLPVLGGEGDGGAGAAPSVLDEPLKEARELAVKGELGKAVEVVAAASAAAPTPADRFRGKLAVAKLCLGAGQHAIARSQLEGLVLQIERHQLTGWDPTLCAEVYAALYTAIKGVNAAKASAVGPSGAPVMSGQPGVDVLSDADRAAERVAFESLCQLDPAEALKLGGVGGAG